MTFEFSHTFEDVNYKDKEVTPNFPYLSVAWKLELDFQRPDSDYILIASLMAEPLTNASADTLFEYTADVKAIFKSEESAINDLVIEIKDAKFHKTKKDGGATKGTELLRKPYDECNLTNDLTIEVTLQVTNIDGISNFHMYSFVDSAFNGADVILKFGDESLYCHSQILSLHSEFFGELLKNWKIKSLKPIQSSKPGNKRKVNKKLEIMRKRIVEPKFSALAPTFELPKEEMKDFELLLSIMYAHHRDIVNEKNVERFLQLGDKYEMNIILNFCEYFLISFDGDITKQQIAIWAWKYDLNTLKNFIFDKFKWASEFKEISCSILYQELSNETKVELWEAAIATLTD